MSLLLVNILEYLTAGCTSLVYSYPYDLSVLNRPYVQSLTFRVSGNCQKSYTMYDEALGVYQDLKVNNLVRIVRNYGDKNIFGLVEDAME
jgi:hypothetical protein